MGSFGGFSRCFSVAAGEVQRCKPLFTVASSGISGEAASTARANALDRFGSLPPGPTPEAGEGTCTLVSTLHRYKYPAFWGTDIRLALWSGHLDCVSCSAAKDPPPVVFCRGP